MSGLEMIGAAVVILVAIYAARTGFANLRSVVDDLRKAERPGVEILVLSIMLGVLVLCVWIGYAILTAVYRFFVQP